MHRSMTSTKSRSAASVRTRTTLFAGILTASLGCSSLTGDQKLPAGTADPSSFNTPAGAVGMYNAALYAFVQAVQEDVLETGALTDEITSTATEHLNVTVHLGTLDQRSLPEGSIPGENHGYTEGYSAFQRARGLANQAIGALAEYGTGTSPALRGELHVVQGYAELMLADLFCSGIPLSTLDYQGDFTYQPGSTTQQVYLHALAEFDTALALSSDSVRVMNWARVGRGRALLALDSVSTAAQAVSAVPTDFAESIAVKWSNGTITGNLFNQVGTVANNEGLNGLPYRSGDPRSTVQLGEPVNYGVGQTFTQYFPVKYGAGLTGAGYAPVMVATGVEARLIEAEADLRAGGTQWLTILNALRTNGVSSTGSGGTLVDTLGVTHCGGSFGLCGSGPGGSDTTFGKHNDFPGPGYTLVFTDTTYPAPAGVQSNCNARSWYKPCYAGDTMVVLTYTSPATTYWNPGTGGVGGLEPLSDSGATLSGTAATNARVDLLFHERAYWLFLTGQRQADLRRLVRQYQRVQSTVYPTGIYQPPNISRYGGDVTAPIPTSEQANPIFHGCINRDV